MKDFWQDQRMTWRLAWSGIGGVLLALYRCAQ